MTEQILIDLTALRKEVESFHKEVHLVKNLFNQFSESFSNTTNGSFITSIKAFIMIISKSLKHDIDPLITSNLINFPLDKIIFETLSITWGRSTPT